MTWSWSQVVEFLEAEPRVGRLATVDPAGRPHVVPVWFLVDGDTVLVHTASSSRKGRDIERTGRFALSIDTDTWPYRGITIRGPARRAPEGRPPWRDVVERTSRRYLGPVAGPAMADQIASGGYEHAVYVLEAETWATFDFS